MSEGLPPLEEGDYYLTEQGYKVFTEQYHLKRGYCCQRTVGTVPLTIIQKGAD